MFDVGVPIFPWTCGQVHAPRPKKPIISHETGNYITFTRPDHRGLSGTISSPSGYGRQGRSGERLGLLAETPLGRNSERLYLLCHKFDLEALRKSPYISGHHWWLFQDYWTTFNGLVDLTFARSRSAPKKSAGSSVTWCSWPTGWT